MNYSYVLLSISAICTAHLTVFDFTTHTPVQPHLFNEAVNDWDGFYHRRTNDKADRGPHPKVDSNQLLQLVHLEALNN